MRAVVVLVHSQGLVKRLLGVCAAAAAEIEISELRPGSRHPGGVVDKTLLLSLYGIRPMFLIRQIAREREAEPGMLWRRARGDRISQQLLRLRIAGFVRDHRQSGLGANVAAAPQPPAKRPLRRLGR